MTLEKLKAALQAIPGVEYVSVGVNGSELAITVGPSTVREDRVWRALFYNVPCGVSTVGEHSCSQDSALGFVEYRWTWQKPVEREHTVFKLRVEYEELCNLDGKVHVVHWADVAWNHRRSRTLCGMEGPHDPHVPESIPFCEACDRKLEGKGMKRGVK